MRITSCGICRANWKIYEKLEVEGIKPEQTLKALVPSATTPSSLPCKVFELEDSAADAQGSHNNTNASTSANTSKRYIVAVTPIMAGREGGTYTLATFNEDGSLAECAEHTVSYEDAKWASRKNRLANKALVAEIERYDERHAEPKPNTPMSVSLVRALATDTHMICEFKLTLSFTEPENVCVSVLNQNLSPLEDLIDMGSSKVATRAADSVFNLELTYSIKVPWDQQKLYVCVELKNNEAAQATFIIERSELDASIAAMEQQFLDVGRDPYYAEWLKNQQLTPEELGAQRSVELAWQPKFSIIVPLYKTPLTFFAEMLASVREQTYTNWELILVNASPEIAELKEAVARACTVDERVRCVELAENLGISLNTNAGIEVATGEFVSFFDHDDIIEPNLFFEYAKALNADSAIDVLYCDEDILTPEGNHQAVFFKPDFNIDLLRCNNYICHLLTIRKSLLDTLEPNTKEFDGAQDHNLTLEATEKTTHVHHVSKVLYHWRMSANSTAGNMANKSYATDAGVRAVSAHLERLGLAAEVKPSGVPFVYSVNYLPPEDMPLVSVIIPTYEHADVLERCVNSILEKTTYPNYEIVLVENNSKSPETFTYYQELIARQPRVRVVTYKGEFNFSKIINFGVTQAKGDYLLLLNNDTEVITPEWMSRLVGLCARKEVGCAGVRLYYPNDTIQHAGVALYFPEARHLGTHLPRGRWGYFELANRQRDLSAVTAACLMTTRNAFEQVGGFDEDFAVAYNDVDFCLKLREAGKLVVYTPEVELYHYESLSRGLDNAGESRTRLYKEMGLLLNRHPDIFGSGDPMFTRNITPAQASAVDYYHF